MSGFLQLWLFLASFIPWVLIDRIGRRPLVRNHFTQVCNLSDERIQASFYDIGHGSGHGCPSSHGVPSSVQNIDRSGRRHRWCGNALHLRRRVRDWLPSNRVGLSKRNLASSIAPEGVGHLHGLELDLQLHYRANNPTCNREHWMEDLHNLCRLKRDHILPFRVFKNY